VRPPVGHITYHSKICKKGDVKETMQPFSLGNSFHLAMENKIKLTFLDKSKCLWASEFPLNLTFGECVFPFKKVGIHIPMDWESFIYFKVNITPQFNKL
jgi:hypothetical protein